MLKPYQIINYKKKEKKMMSFLTSLFSVLPEIIAAASAIAAITPTPKDNAAIAAIYKVLDLCALNIFKAKDK